MFGPFGGPNRLAWHFFVMMSNAEKATRQGKHAVLRCSRHSHDLPYDIK